MKAEKSLEEFAKGYKKYGFNKEGDDLVYREWAPGAKEVYLTGEFNGWDRRRHRLTPDAFGNWEIRLPFNEKGEPPIRHESRVKAHVLNANNEWQDKVPVWSKRVVQNLQSNLFDC